jgi:hypothetical protein
MSVGMSVNHTKTILDVLLKKQFDENCTLLGYYAASSGQSQPQGSRIQKKPVIPVQSLYREKCGQWKVSAVWCQQIGLLQVEHGG